MKKFVTAAGVAVLSLSFAAFGYAAQGQTDTGGASGQVSPSSPDTTNPSMGGDRGSHDTNMGSDRGSQRDTDTGATKHPKKKRKSSGESSSSMGGDSNMGSSSKPAPAPPVGSEGSNPSLDKTGKGSASGG